jgi:hypothetical protein
VRRINAECGFEQALRARLAPATCYVGARDPAPLPRAKTFTASGGDDLVPFVLCSSLLTRDVLLRSTSQRSRGVPVAAPRRGVRLRTGPARKASTGDVLGWSPRFGTSTARQDHHRFRRRRPRPLLPWIFAAHETCCSDSDDPARLHLRVVPTAESFRLPLTAT